MPKAERHKAGTYLTDSKRLIYVVRRLDAEQPGQLVIEDVATNKPAIVGDADLAGYRPIKREEQPNDPKKSA